MSKILPVIILIFFLIPFYLELSKKKNLASQPKITFWQYWSGTEKEPLADLVNKFNNEDHGFQVEMLNISMPRKKILMSITGSVPPDLVHLDGDMVSDFALRNALMPLDELNDFINEFIPVYTEMLNIKGTQWAIPMMPTCEAMHINKNLLNEFNLTAPETLDDLENIFNTATDFKNFKHIGWLPSWPPWSARFLPVLFGGRWAEVDTNGEVKITANSDENIAAWTWVQQKIASKIPADKLAAFTEGFSAYQSPDNPFYTGRIALENNGVWEENLASKFAPDLDLEIVPFPGTVKQATLVTVDALAIPKGSKNSKKAFEFIRWLLKPENIEYLALKQKKFSPLKKVSDDFYAQHTNPYIKVFVDLANSPNAVYFPQVSFVQMYRREIKSAYNKMLRRELSAKEALDELQKAMEVAI